MNKQPPILPPQGGDTKLDRFADRLFRHKSSLTVLVVVFVVSFWVRFTTLNLIFDLEGQEAIRLGKTWIIVRGAAETACAVAACALLFGLLSKLRFLSRAAKRLSQSVEVANRSLKTMALGEHNIGARVALLPEPFKAIARYQHEGLLASVRDMEAHSFEKHVVATSAELRQTFVSIMKSAQTHMYAVTVPKYWDYDVMGGRYAIREYVVANEECATEGVTILRYLVGDKADINQLIGGVRGAIVRLVKAEESLRKKNERGELRLYYIYFKNLPDGYEADNFGLWDDATGADWIVKMNYRTEGTRAVFKSIKISRFQSGADVGTDELWKHLTHIRDEIGENHRVRSSTSGVEGGVRLLMRDGDPVSDGGNHHEWRGEPEIEIVLLQGESESERIRARLHNYHVRRDGGIGIGLRLPDGAAEPKMEHDAVELLIEEDMVVPDTGRAMPRRYTRKWSGYRTSSANHRFYGWGLVSESNGVE